MAAYNSAIDNVYNYYLTTYAPRTTDTKYDTHKKSELRGVYNSMLKLNKDAPLYILDSGRESREFAIGLKEDARELRNTIASLGGVEDAQMFNKKSAYSTDEGMVTAEYLGEASESQNAPTFEIEVKNLASNQENLGYALKSDEPTSLKSDAYSFDITINDLSYEFQFNVREGDTNKDILERLNRLINNANIGIKSDVLEDGKGSSAIRLSSDNIGLPAGRNVIFDVNDDQSSKAKGAVDYLGIDYISKAPSNASFLLNGEERTATTNHFTIDKTYELTLNGVSQYEGQSAQIGIKTDLESVTENVGKLVKGYNNFIKTASEYRALHPSSSKLMNEMDRLVTYYKSGLNDIGVEVKEDGQLDLNPEEFASSISGDENFEKLTSVKGFASSILRKANQISLNPMEYVDKTVVAYKKPGVNFTAPYVSSNYSGMLFNSYC